MEDKFGTICTGRYNRQSVQEWSQGGVGPGRYCPDAPSDRSHSPRLARQGVNVWSEGAAGPLQQLEGVGLESGGGGSQFFPGAHSEFRQIVPNSSSLYTHFYSVIYNSEG